MRFGIILAALVALSAPAFVPVHFDKISIVSVAQADEGDVQPSVPAENAPAQPAIVEPGELDAVIAAINGVKGGGALAIAFLVAQLLMFGIKKFGDKIPGGWQLVIASFLTIACGVLSSMLIEHVTFAAALVKGANLAAISVFLNQVAQKFILKKA